jgi:hypothetical protein
MIRHVSGKRFDLLLLRWVGPIALKLKLFMTYVDDPVLGVVSVGPADVEPAAIAHRLYDSDVVAAVEMLEKKIG